MFNIRCIGCQRCSREAISMWYHDHQLRWDEVSFAKMWRGTGKTATFVIGALQRIDYSVSRCQALMLAPTREAQMHWYCRGCCRMYNVSWWFMMCIVHQCAASCIEGEHRQRDSRERHSRICEVFFTRCYKYVIVSVYALVIRDKDDKVTVNTSEGIEPRGGDFTLRCAMWNMCKHQELANQIYKVALALGDYLKVKAHVCTLSWW